ncbi:MAG TPA: amino acid ABC transporter permease, partial [Candidatus Megaira endosymbiont of Hartmannula sinica]|nr:amino acid ABC transporter permease [Candidatus Megaera endosymbiont of Hartmannula sinica]
TSLFRGTPVIVQLSLIYFGLPSIFIKFDVFTAGVIALAMNSGAYISEIIRAGINAVPKGQTEAAKVLGITPVMRMKDIILPQAVKKITPALINEFINLIKESALISIIGANDLMRRANIVSAEKYDFFMPMLTVALVYYFIVIVVSIFGVFIEKKYALEK